MTDADVVLGLIEPARFAEGRLSVDEAAAGAVLEQLIFAMEHFLDTKPAPERKEWFDTIHGWQEKYPLTYEQSEPGSALKPFRLSA